MGKKVSEILFFLNDVDEDLGWMSILWLSEEILG